MLIRNVLVGGAPFPPEVRAAAIHLACQKPGSDLPLDAILEFDTESGDSPLICPLADDALARPLLRRVLRWDEEQGWCLFVPVSRFSSAMIALLLVALGIVATISARTVRKWFKSAQLKPWKFRSWITAKDLGSFLERAMPVLDLYQRSRDGQLAENEAVYSIDEKTSIQGRHRASYRPPGFGEPAHLESSYTRKGAVQLFAALNVATGKILPMIRLEKKFEDFAAFLHSLVRHAVEQGQELLHLVLDNGSCHRPKYLRNWIEAQDYPIRIIVHWLPPRSSWLNQVENFFSHLQSQVLNPNVFRDLMDVAARILGYIWLHNERTRPLDWTYTSNDLRRKYRLPPGEAPSMLAAALGGLLGVFTVTAVLATFLAFRICRSP